MRRRKDHFDAINAYFEVWMSTAANLAASDSARSCTVRIVPDAASAGADTGDRTAVEEGAEEAVEAAIPADPAVDTSNTAGTTIYVQGQTMHLAASLTKHPGDLLDFSGPYCCPHTFYQSWDQKHGPPLPNLAVFLCLSLAKHLYRPPSAPSWCIYLRQDELRSWWYARFGATHVPAEGLAFG